MTRCLLILACCSMLAPRVDAKARSKRARPCAQGRARAGDKRCAKPAAVAKAPVVIEPPPPAEPQAEPPPPPVPTAEITPAPTGADLLVQLAQQRRSEGRPLAALSAAERSGAPQEIARAYADLGLPSASERALASSTAPPDLQERWQRLRQPVLAVSSAASQDSFGILRIAPRATVAALLPLDITLVAGGGVSHLEQGATSVDNRMGGATLGVRFARLSLAAGIDATEHTNFVGEDDQESLTLRIVDGWQVTAGRRHRLFLEAAEPLATDEQAYYVAGAWGASDLGALSNTQVNEYRLATQAAPANWLYAYVDGRGFQISDGNRGYSVAAGMGLNVIGVLTPSAPVALYAKWDAFLEGFAQMAPSYYTPSFFDAQSFGGDLRWRIAPGFEVSGNAGRSLSVSPDRRWGWYSGGGLDLINGRLTLLVRGQYRDDLYYTIKRGWLALDVTL